MKINEKINCPDFPCKDVDTKSYILPDRDIHVENTQIIMITEAPPNNAGEYFYSQGNPFYLQTTLQAFRDAGAGVASVQDILDLGVYITTAIKCGKNQYAISSETMRNCSGLLEHEMALFPDVKAYMLMGDVAIKMMNGIFKKQTGKNVIPAGSTYKTRRQSYYWEGKRVFPSYTPAGKNFLIEKSKRRMVAEDIKEALNFLAL